MANTRRPTAVLLARIAFWQAIIVALITAAGGWLTGYFSSRPAGEVAGASQGFHAPSAVVCDKFSVRINERSEQASETQPILVSGTAGSLPPDLRLWVVATGPRGSDKYWPRDEATVTGGSWSVTLQPRPGKVVDLKAEDEKRFAVAVVSPAGQILIESYFGILRELNLGKTWPALRKREEDVVAICPGRHQVVLTEHSTQAILETGPG